MDKNFTEENYIRSVENSMPDLEAMKARILDSESESDDISPFVSAYEQLEEKKRPVPVMRVMAAAAMIALVAALPTIIRNSAYENSMTASDNSAMYDECADEAPAAEKMFEDSVELDSSHMIYSCRGWDYNTAPAYSGLVYEDVFPDTDLSVQYTGFIHDGDDEYFVEDDVLRKTDFFLDAYVIDAYPDDDIGKTVCNLNVIRLISDDEGMSVPESITVLTDSPYGLIPGREYLIPMTVNGNEYSITFENSPQIEFTHDRMLVAHNGWKSFSDNAESLMCSQSYKDDYFYDRMDIVPECALDDLFSRWYSME